MHSKVVKTVSVTAIKVKLKLTLTSHYYIQQAAATQPSLQYVLATVTFM
jgi:hypothetical protein